VNDPEDPSEPGDETSRPLPLRLLVIEDSEDDALLLVRELQRSGYDPAWERVDTAAALETALQRRDWEVITCDYVMPRFSAGAALRIIRAHAPDVPVIIVSGEVGEEVAVTCMKAGAQDYVGKHKLARLVPAIERELRDAEARRVRAEAERAFRESENRFRALIENTSDLVSVVRLDGIIVYASPSHERLLGYAVDELIGGNAFDLVDPEDFFKLQDLLRQGNLPGSVGSAELRLRHKNGTWMTLDGVGKNMLDDPAVAGIVITSRDVTERKRTEQRLGLLTTALEVAANGVVITDRSGSIVWVNRAFTRASGYTAAEAVGHNPRLLKSGRHDASFYESLWDTITSGRVWRGTVVNRRKDGVLYTEETTITPVPSGRGEITHFIAIQQPEDRSC
jgi:sigma-B regulation protein RsbU (phosphoserine phosphatase)